MKTLTFEKPPGFALRAASDFYSGFVPGSGMAAIDGERLTLAFRLDRSFEAVVVELLEKGDCLLAQVTGTDETDAVSTQLMRMLGLEADANAWLELGRREPVVGKLQSEFPGFFTAAKASPYDAATWGVLSPRMTMLAAARLKQAISRRYGAEVRSSSGMHYVFPAPDQVLALEAFPALAAHKLERLKGVARAALEGKLDATYLRSLSVDQALAGLEQLPGVGPWTASHILFRGAALIDAVPTAEPRVFYGLADAFGLREPVTAATLERLSDGFRPFRTWVCVLLARHLAKIGAWNRPGLGRERAAAGRRASRATRG